MLQKKIKYTDFNGETREETFYFNLSQSELYKLENSESGGLTKRLQFILERKDAPSIMDTFTDLIKWSYGEPSPDGRRFNKSDEIYADFSSTMAYDELFMELCTNSESAIAFVQGILPKDIAKEINQTSIDELMASRNLSVVSGDA